jgi:hypothetical protein
MKKKSTIFVDSLTEEILQLDLALIILMVAPIYPLHLFYPITNQLQMILLN